MSLKDEILELRRQLSGANLRLNAIRAYAGGVPVGVVEDDVVFHDDFADASRHWAWYDYGTGATRTITEAGGVLTIATAAGTSSDWWTGTNQSQKAIIGIPGFPVEIITKLNSYVVNDSTGAGLLLGRLLTNGAPAADSAICIMRLRSDAGGLNGYAVQNLGGAVWAYQATTTLPVWFKIQVGFDGNMTGAGSLKSVYSYSTDGVAWTVLYTGTSTPAGSSSYPVMAGIFGKTYGALNALSAPFEFFQMRRSFGPG